MSKAVKKLKEAGFDVNLVHFNIKRSLDELAKLWCESISIDTAIEMNNYLEQGLDVNDLPEEFIHYNNLAAKWGIKEFEHFNLVRSELYDAFQDIFDEYDIIISPTTTCLPVINKENGNTKGPDSINGKVIEPLIGFAETFLVNFTGHPAASIPVGLSKNGLSVGMQVITKRYRDEDVLKFARTFEKMSPWRHLYKF